jgi:hypothetical protein
MLGPEMPLAEMQPPNTLGGCFFCRAPPMHPRLMCQGRRPGHPIKDEPKPGMWNKRRGLHVKSRTANGDSMEQMAPLVRHDNVVPAPYNLMIGPFSTAIVSDFA